MYDVALASTAIAEELTLIIPLGLLVLTLIGLGWLLHGRGGPR